MARILVLFAHPAFERSRVQRGLVEAVTSMEGLTFHDLYEAYPHFDVDIQREQDLLLAHDLVVLQHPFYWYSTPALVKQWEDLVLEHGWAYGTGGTALHGKRVLSAISTGGPEAAYQTGDNNQLAMRTLLSPLEQTARLCGMDYLPPFLVHGTHRLPEARIHAAAARYRLLLEAFRDDRVDPNALRGLERIPDDVTTIMRSRD